MLKILIFLFLYVKSKIITGPIIGKVTETTARILIETDTDEHLILFIYSTNKFSVNKEFKAKHPNVISLNNLIPETKYYLFRQWTGKPSIDMISIGSFKTLSGNLDKNFNVVIVACNDYKNINIGSHWYNIVRQVKRGEVDYIFHIGDQVYLDHESWLNNPDSAYNESLELYQNNKDENMERNIREVIQDVYRKTYGYPNIEALSRVPNLMMIDDHEIYNNFAFNEKNEFEEIFEKQARYAYYLYQRQLWEDIDFDNFENTSDEFKHIILNDIGFIWTEYRASKAWHGYKGDLFLDNKQHALFRSDIYNNTGLVWLSTNPVFLFSTQYTRYMAQVHQDFQEQWTFSHEAELLDLLDYIGNNTKDIFFIGGDVHAAGFTEIYHKGKPFAMQLITSAIEQASTPPQFL